MNLTPIADKSKAYLEKLRALPEEKKKIILYSIVVILAVVMIYFWLKSVASGIESFDFNGQAQSLMPQ